MFEQTYYLHGIPISFTTADRRFAARLAELWRPFRNRVGDHLPSFRMTIVPVAETPAPPHRMPEVARSAEGVGYYLEGHYLAIHFRKWGRYDVDLKARSVQAWMHEACLHTYGVFEDMIVIAIAPLLRRQGYYPIHAFAAAFNDRAVLLVGDTGTGKTTTGINLLRSGARLLANDSPLIRRGSESLLVCAYPGLLSTYPQTLGWFPETCEMLGDPKNSNLQTKIAFPAERLWPGIWAHQASPSLLLFPHVHGHSRTTVAREMSRPRAFQILVGSSIENWDKDTIADNLISLRHLVEQSTPYELHLAPDLAQIPDIIRQLL